MSEALPKCLRRFKVTPFKHHNVSGRTDMKTCNTAGAEASLPRPLRIPGHRPGPHTASIAPSPASGTARPGRLGLTSWPRTGGCAVEIPQLPGPAGAAQVTLSARPGGTESKPPLCHFAGCLSLLVPGPFPAFSWDASY